MTITFDDVQLLNTWQVPDQGAADAAVIAGAVVISGILNLSGYARIAGSVRYDGAVVSTLLVEQHADPTKPAQISYVVPVDVAQGGLGLGPDWVHTWATCPRTWSCSRVRWRRTSLAWQPSPTAGVSFARRSGRAHTR